jgi:glyoxylase-like metal-dependent hydrolase (beta-lactamase superfamily II)
METFTYFKSKKISNCVTRIFGPAGELIYLIEGSKQAALIDTGTGVGNLKAFVENLTSKPIFIILTHGHVDHAMGASAFDEVYMNPADNDVYGEHCDMSARKEFLKMNMGEDYALIKEEDYIQVVSCDRFKPILPGDTFDLGGINLEICIGAGHTLGSITILIKEERTLILGDACWYFTWLFDEHSLGVTSYEKSLMELDKQTKGRYDRIYSSHGDGDGPKEMVESVIEVCEEIKEGKTDDLPYEFLGYKAFIAKAMDFKIGRFDGGIGNIVYSKEKIYL